jgi:hypothetical protein
VTYRGSRVVCPGIGGTNAGRRAIESLKKKAEFRVHLLAYVLVNAFLVVIWAVSGRQFFWPVFPIAGWGIGIVFHAWDAYRPKVLTEEEIRREMARLGRGSEMDCLGRGSESGTAS